MTLDFIGDLGKVLDEDLELRIWKRNFVICHLLR